VEKELGIEELKDNQKGDKKDMEMKKLIPILILGMFLISVVSAYAPHALDTDWNVVINSNNATACNVSYIQYFNGSLNYINGAMVQTSSSFNYTVLAGNFTYQGDVCVGIECTDGVTKEVGSSCRTVTYNGKEITSAQSTIYLGLLAILIFILVVTFWVMGYLPTSNTQDEEGRILSISYLKYFRLVLWLFAYFQFLAIIFLSSNLAFAYLGEQLFANLLFNIFRILLGIAPLLVVVLIITFFVKLFQDKQMQKLLNRGIFPGGTI